MSRQLAGAVVWGGWSCTSAATRGRGRALLRFWRLPFECLRKTRGALALPFGAVPEGLGGVAVLRPLFPGGQEEQSRRVFFYFQEDCVPSMNTEPLGHVAISWHRWPVT